LDNGGEVAKVRPTFMKNNALTATFLGMLLVSTLFTAVLTYRYIASLRKLRGLQPVIIQINYNRNFMQSLVNETQEYSKKYPSLVSLLQSIGQKNSPGAAATAPARPATK
jgi:hypothetical protein